MALLSMTSIIRTRKQCSYVKVVLSYFGHSRNSLLFVCIVKSGKIRRIVSKSEIHIPIVRKGRKLSAKKLDICHWKFHRKLHDDDDVES